MKKSRVVEDELVSIGSFENKHGEFFVLLQMRVSHDLWITGDETAWEPVKLDGNFILSEDEMKEVEKLVNSYVKEAV